MWTYLMSYTPFFVASTSGFMARTNESGKTNAEDGQTVDPPPTTRAIYDSLDQWTAAVHLPLLTARSAIIMSNSPKKSSGKMHRTKTVKKSAKKAKHISKDTGNQDIEDMDLGKAMFPLRHYLNNRSEFVDQLFQSLGKGNLLQSMLPDILRDIPQTELKKLCVQQLEVMSKKRVGRILDGNEMESSSETEDSDAENKTQEVKIVREEKETERQAADSTSCDVMEIPNEPLRIQRPMTKMGKAEDDMLELHADSADDVMLEIVESGAPQGSQQVMSQPEIGSLPQPAVIEEPLPLLASTSITKTCMEIMELELRARAIKSLLKTQASKEAP